MNFVWGGKNWLIDALLQLNACKNLHHCDMQQGSFTMAKDLNHRQFSSNLHLRISGFGSWSYSGNWKPQSYWIDPPTKIATWKYTPTQCLVNFKECRGSDYRKTTLQTNGSPNKKDSNQISSSTAPHWLPVGTRSYSHCGCDVTVGISHKVGLGGWIFTQDGSTVIRLTVRSAILKPIRLIFRGFRSISGGFSPVFFSMSGLSVRFFEGHFLVLEFTTLEFGSSLGWSDWIVSMKQISRRDLNGSIPRDVVKRCKDEI